VIRNKCPNELPINLMLIERCGGGHEVPEPIL